MSSVDGDSSSVIVVAPQHCAFSPLTHPTANQHLPLSRRKSMASDQVDPAPHACRECNARFTRLEHLQRHITSLHRGHSPKPHPCQYCGKRFARRDVLLRHHQSCRAAKQSPNGPEDRTKTTKRTCETCSELKLKCSGGPRCERCSGMGVECVFEAPPRRQSTAGSTKNAAPWPSPDTDPLVLSNDQSVDRRLSAVSSGIFCEPSHIDPTLTQNASNSFFPSQSDQDAAGILTQFTQNHDEQLRWEGWRTQDQDGQAPQRTLSVISITEEPSPKARKPANKRGRYVSNACLDAARPQTNGATLPDEAANLSEKVLQMMARITSLERDRNMLKTHLSINNDQQSPSQENDSSSPSGSTTSATSIPESEQFHGATCLFTPIEVLNRVVACHDEEQHGEPTPDNKDTENVKSVYWTNLSPGGNKTIEAFEKETRLGDVASLRHYIDIYFSYMNPHYPSLNENQFRADFDRFLSNHTSEIETADLPQFIALINLMHAEVKLLSDDWSDSSLVPAWDEFCRAESILNRLTWLGNGNMLTIQCLLIKARYLLYIEKSDGAYDTMAKVVRLCFQVGLHDQNSWKDCTPFETVMRQRIFWTIYYLERNIAFNNGSPYLIRDTDFRVDLPKGYEDKFMFPDRPLPEENPERSSGPYLCSAIKWGKMCAEIWDSVFATSAPKPASQEFIASMDARVQYAISQIPPHLQYLKNLERLDTPGSVPSYVLRQTVILHLRMNQLRLILRQESILSLTYSEKTADEVVSIAATTIDALYAYHSRGLDRPTGRFSSVFYSVAPLLNLVCIIVKADNPPETRTKAIESFKKGLSTFNDMSSNFTLARHTLRRLYRIIETAKRAILKFHGAELLDTTPKELQFDTIMPHISDFFNQNTMDGDDDMLNQLINGFSTTNEPSMVRGTGGEEIDGFWVDDELRRLFDVGGLQQ
ncbi:uncharacterized protein BDZ99DRAFT_577019 [Mytilinidion resinicola]|uniref:C2H2-type domain-containing protein n=1 Tax=Mytilinidion resinicola TaxID=574789 RepID=A0A6A6Y0K3_9PEZI|nr:uncharacterized protein BDZ99DRAFT_577019 [Mytilinidion resinicola]KAF2802341.1 hypothetical protein BDZ99DRAFT_577019 [Mytilinidion resinicola]